MHAVEINENAVAQARAPEVAEIEQGSILEPMSDIDSVDLASTLGVLIHINPESLDAVYENLVTVSRRYIMVGEYYNPTPDTIDYRGNKQQFSKRDFAGDLIDKYGLRLVNYGFVYKRDNCAPQDDVNWFLLEK